MKRTMFAKVNLIGGLTLLSSSFLQAFIPAIPATEGSRQILVTRIAPQENALETKVDTLSSGAGTGLSAKIDIIDTNVDDIETSVGVGLSVKADRINNNMRTPITATTTIATSGSYRLANNFAGSITVTASDVDIDFNGFKILGTLTISSDKVFVHDGIVEGSGGLALVFGDGAGYVVIENMKLSHITGTPGDPVVDIPGAVAGRPDIYFKHCFIVKEQGAGDLGGLRCSSSNTRLYIQDCSFLNISREACLINAVSVVVIENCIFDNCGSLGFPFALTLSAGTNNIVRNNLIKRCYRGIYIATASTNNQIMFNTIIGCADTSHEGCAIEHQSSSADNITYSNISIDNYPIGGGGPTDLLKSYLNVYLVSNLIGTIGVSESIYANLALE